MSILPLLHHLIPFVLVAFRLAGIFALTPLLSSTMLPRQAKIAFLLTLAALVYPTVPASYTSAPLPTTLFGLLPLIVSEALVGLIIGAIAAVPLITLEMSGTIMGQQMGFGLARVYNPEMDTDVDILGQLLFFMGTGTFLVMGGLEILLTTLVGTFRTIPMGRLAMGDAPLDLYVAVFGQGVELSMRCAMPVVATILILVVIFGVVGKTMPQINIMSVGFMFKILAGIAVFALALPHVGNAIGEKLADTSRAVQLWAAEPPLAHAP